jgi:hypothetical protein
MTFTHTALLWAFVFMLLGASVYGTDKKWGVSFFGKIRKWWNPPAPGETPVERGFIVNRSNVSRWNIAGLIGAMYVVIMIGIRHEDPRTEIMLFFVVTPSMFVGFLLGPLYIKFKKWRERQLQNLDKVESGEVNIGKFVGDKLGDLRDAGGDLLKSVGIRSEDPKPAVPAAPPEPPPDPAEEGRKAREILRKFHERKP